jgi:O-antigen ligase
VSKYLSVIKNFISFRFSFIGFSFITTSLACIPKIFFPASFDRNANAQFVALAISATGAGAYLVIKNKIPKLTKKIWISLAVLFLSTAVSTITSGNIIGSMVGDVGRYTGLISLYSLLIIAIYFATIGMDRFTHYLPYFIMGVFTVSFLGLLQQFKLIVLPGDGGFASTLGNIDFLSAWIGTTLPLIMLLVGKRHVAYRVLLIFMPPLSLFLIYKLGPKQGYMDLLIFTFFLAMYKFRRKIKKFSISLNQFSFVASALTLLWIEAMLVIPIVKIPIPFIVNEAQVLIRSTFWTSGISMFLSKPFLGVGPDNFGYHYEQHRSLYSFKTNEFLITNDAHSSVIQSIATLGIFSMLAFIALLIILIRSLYINYNRYPRHRATFYWLGVFFLLFITNSNISPITLPHKFLFWALAGFSIGAAYKNGLTVNVRKVIQIPIRAGIASVTALSLLISLNFALDQVKFDLALEQAKKQKTPTYTLSNYIPCLVYYNTQENLLTFKFKSNEKMRRATAKQSAEKALDLNSRCLAAKMALTKIAFLERDIPTAKKLVYELLEQAPARRDVINLASIYALTQNDFPLQRKLIRQGQKLDFIEGAKK